LVSDNIGTFNCTETKAWERQVELVVYDPAQVDSSGQLLGKGESLGLVVSGLDIEFKVKRSRSYAENTAEFKIYNAKPETRARLTTPGMRVRFSAGYRDMTGPIGIFWGSVTAGANSAKVGTDWVTTIPCISSLTESLGSEDIARWAKNNPKASFEEKQAKAASAVNRIPVSLSYAPGTPIRQILRDFGAITGLSILGAEGIPDVTLVNGFVTAGGVRSALDQFKKQCLLSIGWTFYIDNTSLFIYPVDETQAYIVSSAFLTIKGFKAKDGTIAEAGTGFISLTDKTKSNIPPKLVKASKAKNAPLIKVPVPRTYEVKCLLNPKIAPNTLATIEVPSLSTTLLIDSVEFEGAKGVGFPDAKFITTFEGHVYGGTK
jgi:hypothetical protein